MVSGIAVGILYWSAIFGGLAAAQVLTTLSMPKFNVFAALIPDDLSQSRWGMELMLGVILLQSAVVLTLVICAGWVLFRKR